MKKILTISERGILAQELQHKDHFYTDIKLYNEHFPGSKLSSQLAKANEHNMPSLHSRMLYDLLTKVDPEDVLENRKPVELQIVGKTDSEKENELRLNVISQIKVLLKNGFSVANIKDVIGNQPVKDGDPTLDKSAFNDLVDTTVEVFISENPDYVLTIDEDSKVDDTNVTEVTNVPTVEVVNSDDTNVTEVTNVHTTEQTKVDDTKLDETLKLSSRGNVLVDQTSGNGDENLETKIEEVAPEVITEEAAPVVEDEKKSDKNLKNSQK